MTKTTIAGFEHEQILAPLVIGITGHRDIRDEDRQVLKDKIRQIFHDLGSQYSSTPLILLSALAEGADRLAAEVALAPGVGVSLIAALPMPIELYEQDFDRVSVLETAEGNVTVNVTSRGEFRSLLDKAKAYFEMGLAKDNKYETIAHPGPHRDRQYELVGEYIAKQSQILIALWDGVETSRTGGTASVVRFQTEGVPGLKPCELESPEGFPVYHILTPRLKNPFPQGEVFSLTKVYPKVFQGNQAQAEKYYARMFRRLDQFNRYVTDRDPDLAKKVAKSKSYLLQDIREDELPADMRPALNRYAVADALAIRFQKRLVRAQKGLHWGTFFSFFFFLLFADQEKYRSWFLSGSCALFVVALVFHRIFSKKWVLDTQHADYRAMAEGLRVKFFWKLAGVKEAVADHYLGKQRSELDWIRNGFRGWNVAEGPQNHGNPESVDSETQRNRLGFVRKYWIDHQLEYFRRAAERNIRSQEWFERCGYISVLGVLILSIILTGLYLLNHERHHDYIVIALETLLASAALLHHFNNRMAYAEYAKQYQRMASLFARGSELLGKWLDREDYDTATLCVRNVGKEALTENGDWVLLRRERRLEIPHP